jgi:phosphoenolpyruvate---glycerone phosphotransferase subunit DhaL
VAPEPRSALDGAAIVTWMSEIATTMRAERDHLVRLDAAIGDGDHGVNMNRGFDAVVQALDATDETMPGKLLILAGKTLVSTVGGASGPLWGSAFRRAGRALGDRPATDGVGLADALDAAAAAIAELGGAVPGDKTMLDAFTPAVGALRDYLDSGATLPAALEAAAEAAEEGMRATVPMQARKGRASYLGERSIGHQDPGATSTALVFRALQRAVRADG